MEAIKWVGGTLVVMFIVLAIAGNNSPPRKLTKYQECVESSKHARSENDTQMIQRELCDKLPVEAADMR
jgi:hypothetical protein